MGLFAAVETEVRALNTSQSLEPYKEDKREGAEQNGGKAKSKVVAFNKKYIQSLTEDVTEEDAETNRLESQSNISSKRKGESKTVALNKKHVQDLTEDVDEEDAETIRLEDQSNTSSKRKAKNDRCPLMASHRSNIHRRSITPNPTPCGQRKRQPKPKKILWMPSQLGTSPPVIRLVIESRLCML